MPLARHRMNDRGKDCVFPKISIPIHRKVMGKCKGREEGDLMKVWS